MAMSIKKCLVILLAFSFITISAPLFSVARAETKTDREKAVGLALTLSGLRDQLADRRPLILKQNLGPEAPMDENDVDKSYQSVEESLAVLNNLLIDASAEEKKDLQRLVETVTALRQAEKNHLRSWMELRNGAAQALLTSIALSEISIQVTQRTDALVLGGRISYWRAQDEQDGWVPLEPTEPAFQTLPPIESGGKTASGEKGDQVLTIAPTDQPIGVESREVKPSSDPEQLRLAYEAARAWNSLNHHVYWVSWQIQLAMFNAFPAPTGQVPPAEKAEEAVALFRRLPHLTSLTAKMFNNLPKELTYMETRVNEFAENLEKRNQSLAEYEELSQSALLQAGELRDFYIKRLASK